MIKKLVNLDIRDKNLTLGNHALIMGVVNVTPDSFSGDGVPDKVAAIRHAKQLIAEGADLIDVGGESNRPGAKSVSATEEQRRVLPVVKYLAAETKAVISVDTYKPKVAQAVLRAGAHIINDITGLENRELAAVVAEHRAGIVIMHMQGKPQTMQNNPKYQDVCAEVTGFLIDRAKQARQAGIAREAIVVDPGIGFGKTLEHNLALLHGLRSLVDAVRIPVLVGPSRKSFLGTITERKNPQDRVFGTAASVALAVANGASIIRVHDVSAMRDVAVVADAITRYSKSKDK